MDINSRLSATTRRRTILVGIKMDEEEESRAVLTWCLMKAAPMHVVTTHNYNINQKSVLAEDFSLFSLVKAFDSVFNVYEGFCNLKQVEPKLKICRGSSVPKILIYEADLLAADMIVVGTWEF